MIPRLLPGAGSAWLGQPYKPFETQADPAQPVPFKVPNFRLAEGVSQQLLGDRRKLLKSFDASQPHEQGEALNKFQSQALDILTSGAAQRAFDLDSEPKVIRERYGFMPAFDPQDPMRCGAPNWAQRMLLARRLVEAGVRLVTVDVRWWDFHKQGFDSQRR